MVFKIVELPVSTGTTTPIDTTGADLFVCDGCVGTTLAELRAALDAKWRAEQEARRTPAPPTAP